VTGQGKRRQRRIDLYDASIGIRRGRFERERLRERASGRSRAEPPHDRGILGGRTVRDRFLRGAESNVIDGDGASW